MCDSVRYRKSLHVDFVGDLLSDIDVCRGRVSNSRPPDYEYCLSWRTVRVYQINWHSNQAELPRHDIWLKI